MQLNLVKSYKINQQIFYIFIFFLTVFVNIIFANGLTVNLPKIVILIAKIILMLLTLNVFLYSIYFRLRTKIIYDYHDILILINFVFILAIFVIRELFYGIKVDHVLLFVITIYLFRIFIVTIDDFKKFIFVLFIASLFHILNNLLIFLNLFNIIEVKPILLLSLNDFRRSIGLTTGPLGAAAFFVLLNMLFYTYIYYFNSKLKKYFIIFFILTLALANGRAAIIIFIMYFLMFFIINLKIKIKLNIFFTRLLKNIIFLFIILIISQYLYNNIKIPFLINLVMSIQDFEHNTSGLSKIHTYSEYYSKIFSNFDIFLIGQLKTPLFDFATESVFIGFLLSCGVVPILFLYFIFFHIIFKGIINTSKITKAIGIILLLSFVLLFITNGAFAYPTCIIVYILLGFLQNQINKKGLKCVE